VNHWMGGVKKEMKKKGTEGVFAARARSKGHTTHEEAELDKNKGGKLGKRANLALIYERARQHRHASA
jgi:hypothetical protein